jgi:tyrosyl-DNA phosphodiesterase 2
VDVPHLRASDTILRLVNVHLDSLGDTLHCHAEQLKILSNFLREPVVLFAGDLNTISPENDEPAGRNSFIDAWAMLHGTIDRNGPTWCVSVERRDGLKPHRLDKVVTQEVPDNIRGASSDP